LLFTKDDTDNQILGSSPQPNSNHMSWLLHTGLIKTLQKSVTSQGGYFFKLYEDFLNTQETLTLGLTAT